MINFPLINESIRIRETRGFTPSETLNKMDLETIEQYAMICNILNLIDHQKLMTIDARYKVCCNVIENRNNRSD
jgi:hypothetical protein